LYEFDGDCYQEDITVEKVDGVYRFYATTADGDCQFLLNAGSATKYIKFYKASNATQSNYAQDITLTKVELPTIDKASVTLGEQVILNYYVNLTQEEAANATIVFSVNEQTLDVTGEQIGNRVKFSFFLPPQYMADNIDAKLYIDGNEIDSMSYSIKAYAQTLLNAEDSSDELKRVVSDMLHYGAAAQAYKNHNKDNLANFDVEGILAATDAAPATTDFSLVNADVDSYPAYFLGAGVHFDNVNKLYVRINTTEDVTLTINGVEVAVEDTTIRTDGITVANFATTYTFVLYHDGVEMQTLTYSVNAYAYAMQNNAEMKDLALALYRYGVSAAAYNA
jgi:hypothetical protein